MAWILQPCNPTVEYFQALRERGIEHLGEPYLAFAAGYLYFLVQFFEKNAGISYAEGITEQTCRAMADWLETNGPTLTAEQLPKEWQEHAQENIDWLRRSIRLWRYSGGFDASNWRSAPVLSQRVTL